MASDRSVEALPLAAAFLGRAGRPIENARLGALEAALLEAIERAAQAHDTFALPPPDFVCFLAERLPPAEEPAAALNGLYVADLYLVLGCVRGDRQALRELDERLRREVARVVRQLHPPSLADEVGQRTRERLLVAREGERPKLLDYSGRGPLGGWLYAVASRVLLNLQRRPIPEDPVAPDALADAPAAVLSPELATIKACYRGDFNEAFRSALHSLTSRERNLLRMSICEHLSADRIGAFYGVHRVTIRRWIVAARERVMDQTRQGLRDRLKLEAEEVESMIEVLRSDLDVSISWVFRRTEER